MLQDLPRNVSVHNLAKYTSFRHFYTRGWGASEQKKVNSYPAAAKTTTDITADSEPELNHAQEQPPSVAALSSSSILV